jgi:hypothetical protein
MRFSRRDESQRMLIEIANWRAHTERAGVRMISRERPCVSAGRYRATARGGLAASVVAARVPIRLRRGAGALTLVSGA